MDGHSQRILCPAVVIEKFSLMLSGAPPKNVKASNGTVGKLISFSYFLSILYKQK
jgi:hypothetical protein